MRHPPRGCTSLRQGADKKAACPKEAAHKLHTDQGGYFLSDVVGMLAVWIYAWQKDLLCSLDLSDARRMCPGVLLARQQA